MEYKLFGLPHKSGYRAFLRLISIDEVRVLLSRRLVESVISTETGRVGHFVKTVPPPSGIDCPETPQCEHVVDKVRHLKGVSYYPAWNILREMRTGIYA